MNYQLEVTNKGGHSSFPTPGNAIYRLAEGLTRLSRFSFPVNLNPTARVALESIAEIEGPRTAADIRSVLSGEPDSAALARLTANVAYNVQLRTTCVATLLEGGSAANALPQAARATINCRVMPGESTEEVRAALVRTLADDQISVTHVAERAEDAPSPRHEELWSAIETTAAAFWPGAPVVTVMMSGSTDGRLLRRAGIPTYGHTGLASGEVRAHGKDERVAVKSFFDSAEYLYRLVKRLSGGT